ncbi:hypothetical protein [Amycolatopsis rubida]|nr:hypothetical protein [Amycolatopsis rubida]
MADTHSLETTAAYISAVDLLGTRRTAALGLVSLADIWRRDPRFRESAVPILTAMLSGDYDEATRDEARRLFAEFADEADRDRPPASRHERGAMRSQPPTPDAATA